MELVISGNYVSYMKQLENNYNNPDIFYQLVKLVVHKIHNRTYNRIELLNIWRKLTAGLLNESDVCKKNILCLLEHKIEFLNYHYDNEPMMNLLKYSDIFIFKKVIYTLKSIQNLIGFNTGNEYLLSLSQDINTNCIVMNCLELLHTSKLDEVSLYKEKMEYILELLKTYKSSPFNFTIKYIYSDKLYFTTPLAYMIINNNILMQEYIKSKGGTLDYIIHEPLVTKSKSYYKFFKAEPVNMSLLEYYTNKHPPNYKILISSYENSKKTLRQRREQNITRKKNIVNLNLNLNNINNVKERIKNNKNKRDILLSDLKTYKHKWSKTYPIRWSQNSNNENTNDTKPYIVIGGVGGSGTRVIASILAALGLNIGSDLNEAYDNLSFTLLFKDPSTLILDDNIFNKRYNILKNSILGTDNYLTKEDLTLLEELSIKGRPGHPIQWLKTRYHNILEINNNGSLDNDYLKLLPTIRKPLIGKFGWKEPNSHFIMKRLHSKFKNMKFIMVVRNGLDMAFSNNQNQLRLWGPSLLPNSKFDKHGHIIYTPELSMKYWTLVHKKIMEQSKTMGKNFLMINFDKLCNEPEDELTKLLQFLELDNSYMEEIKSMVDKPSSQGRYKTEDLRKFDKKDIEYAKELGFDIEMNEKNKPKLKRKTNISL
jgi:hypothetical protein